MILPGGTGLFVVIKPSTPAAQSAITTTAATKLERPESGAGPATSSAVRDREKASAKSTAASDPTGPRPPAPGKPWNVSGVLVLLLAGAWTLGVIAFHFPAPGRLGLARASRTNGLPAGGAAAQRQFEACRQECEVPATVVLGAHQDVRSPIFRGRPEAVHSCSGPLGRGLPVTIRRGILLHELSEVYAP